MEVSYNWLKEYVSFDLSPERVAQVLTFIGLEVEEIRTVEDIPGGLEGVVVAEVVECAPHPDSDHLNITKVRISEGGELMQVVCGAPNVAAGQKVLLATVGTSLPAPDGSTVKIKKSKIRGAESYGMICAEDELGIGTSHDGIMVLEPEAVVGTKAKDYLHLGTDTIFTIGLTPNRVDGASHIGVARDFSAWLRFNNLGGELTLPDVSAFRDGEGESIPVEVLSSDGAPRYMGVTLKDIKIGPSPDWLQKKLLAVGLRPISNVVDITNFILMETGQPLHAFDASKIEGGKVVVRRASEGDKFVTLDGVERTLSSGDLMICDTVKPMCIAGIFGGLDSGITESTTSVFLESAYFDPVSIRRTSKRLGIKTDASFRYERGADPEMIPYAAARAVLLMQELAGAKVVGKVREVYPEKIGRKKVSLNFARMEALIGKKIGAETILRILGYMDFGILSSDAEGAEVSVPAYKVDVYRECDVVEEVLRIYGYDNVEMPEHIVSSYDNTPNPDPEAVRVKACDLLAANGFMECMNNSLTRADYYNGLKTYPKANLPMVINPLSSDLNAMRQTLLFSGLEVIAHNLNRQSTDLKLFEMGNVYRYEPAGEGDPVNNLASYSERMHLSMFIVGKGTQYWRNSVGAGHFFALKGYVELLLRRLGVDLNSLEYGAAPADLFSEGLAYRIPSSGKTLLMLGTVAPARLRQFDIKQPVFAAEIDWNQLLKLYLRSKVVYRELPQYPEVRRDLALLLDENVSFADIRKAAFSAEKKILRKVVLFDVYRGDKIPEGKKQYAISLTLQDYDKTLTDKYVEQVVGRVLNALSSQFGAVLR
ncbi:MAG TPA: phenylalanine--tRNA ligase subunit beta [Candidatus Coprenecus stercorigallinarum]|nr:phenylalanine--tRNA ligase subunit beta [Candidatus Coprenecus stercorigallinarum]